MAEDRYVAAIEISSSKIVAVVGKMRTGGQLDIIASEQEKGLESVRYGVIRNVEEASNRISRILNKLERKPAVAPRKIKGLFVGLSGLSLHSIPTRVTKNLPDDTEITDEIIMQMQNQASNTAIDSSLETIDAVPRIFTVGRTETITPKGVVGNSISANYDLIVCRPENKNNLIRTVEDKVKIPIKGIVVTALASGQLILSAEEKRLGCMLVDMGAETTTVTIYKNGHLVYFATLPLGGRNITRDLTSLNLLEERAEETKIANGSAIPREAKTNLKNYNGVRDADVSNIIVARSEEIVVNILKQIQYAEMKDSDLPGGIVVIGGASKLNGMIDLIATKSSLNVRRGSLPQYINLEDTKINSADIIEVASVLYAGATSKDTECLERPEPEKVPISGVAEPDFEPEVDVKPIKGGGFKPPKWWKKFKEGVTGAFGNPEDDSDLLDQ